MSSEGLQPEPSDSGGFLPPPGHCTPQDSSSGENDFALPRRKRKLDGDGDGDDDSKGKNNFFYYPAPPAPAATSADACNFTEPYTDRQPLAYKGAGNRSEQDEWELHTEEVFVRICHDYRIQGQLLSTTFTETAWREMQGKLLLETRIHYGVQQLKSKFCRLRQEWEKLEEIMNGETGDGFCWDPVTRTLVAPNELWDEWLAAHPDVGSYRGKQFPCFDLCSELFSPSGPTGKRATISTGGTFISQDGDERVHCPEKEPASFRTSSYNSKGYVGDGIPGSRDGANNLRLKKGTATQATEVDSATDSLHTVDSAGTELLALEKERDSLIAACIEVLNKMDGLAGHLYLKACDALMAPDRRVMFMAWPDDKRRSWVESLGD